MRRVSRNSLKQFSCAFLLSLKMYIPANMATSQPSTGSDTLLAINCANAMASFTQLPVPVTVALNTALQVVIEVKSTVKTAVMEYNVPLASADVVLVMFAV